MLECKWLTLPWVPIALVGTAVAFLVGFIDLREMLEETEIPPAIQPVHNILL